MKTENSQEKENTIINYTDQWIFEKAFMIDEKEAKELNTKDVTIKRPIIGSTS